MNDTGESGDDNAVSWFRNNFVAAIRDQKVFPKVVVIVPDNYFTKYFHTWYKIDDDIVVGYSRLLKWLMSQYDSMVTMQKDFLPIKSKRNDEPNFMWIVPPHRDYLKSREKFQRKQFGAALMNIASLHDNTYALELKKGWDPSDRSLYNRDE